ncbi:MAG: hypothetical protein IPK59_17645 [Rhodospirillaceae bacterium]|nr:hypothetical protein [Rhodospirillaceae bacterium]
MSLDPVVLALLAGPVAISVAGRNAELCPSVAHAYGCRTLEGGKLIRVFVLREETRQLLADINANGEVATVYSDVRSFRSVQIKGQDARIVPFDTADVQQRLAHGRITADELLALGYPSALAHGYFSVPAKADFVTIEFAPRDVFRQTPGPGAGDKLGKGAKLDHSHDDKAGAA